MPLIISGKTDASVEKYQLATKLAAALDAPEHYETFEKEQTISITEVRTERTCRAVPCRTVPCRNMPCCAVPCCAVTCRIVPYRAVT